MYNIIKLRNELTEKGYADEGLVAWGSSASGALFGGIGGAFGGMHVICKRGNVILVIPFGNKEIYYSKAQLFEKQSIASAKVKGLFLSKSLVIKTTDGKSYKFGITQGAGKVKTILQKMGI